MRTKIDEIRILIRLDHKLKLNMQMIMLNTYISQVQWKISSKLICYVLANNNVSTKINHVSVTQSAPLLPYGQEQEIICFLPTSTKY